VLYLQDGQNCFDGATSFVPGPDGEWQADETAERLIRAGTIEPLILVGVYNAGAERINEYTPTRSAERNIGGQADRYGRLLIERSSR
jgi:predicted alpha/beta superfamily hydrolase